MAWDIEEHRERSRNNYLEQMLDGFDASYRLEITGHFSEVLHKIVNSTDLDVRYEELCGHFQEWIQYYRYKASTDEVLYWPEENKLLRSLLTLMHDIAWDHDMHPHFKLVDFDTYLELNGFNRSN